MAINKKNQAQLLESWGPAVKKITKNAVNESSERFAWMCELAHNHVMALNEESVGGASFPFQTLYNTNGIGNAVPAMQAGSTAASMASPASMGSGDKWPALLPMALQVAARTIGFDLVNTFPLQGPSGVLPFLDYVYAGSKDAYGATPSYDGATANPRIGTKLGSKVDPAYRLYEAPHAFRCRMELAEDASAVKADVIEALEDLANAGEAFVLEGADASMALEFIGVSRLTADPMFKVLAESKNVSLGMVFGENAEVEAEVNGIAVTFRRPRLISALEDQIQGFTGAGRYDSDRWTGTYQDGKKLYEPMDRATGEMQYPRQMSLKVFTKFFQVGTQSVAVAVTQEQIQDLQKQWGIDVLKLVENAAVNELSQSINKHILSRLFALGWKNHFQAFEAEGVNFNLDLCAKAGEKEMEVEFVTYFGEDGEDARLVKMAVPAYTEFGHFENADTIYKKIGVNLLGAGNLIMQRGRRGAANFIVTNWKLATMLQSNSQYAFSPLANTLKQDTGNLYPAGTIAGMTLYVDPMMHSQDTRVLVGRKGTKEEPGLAFCPYILAESVRLISEHTAAPKVLIKSRYQLVDLGWYPELNYVTFFVNTPAGLV